MTRLQAAAAALALGGSVLAAGGCAHIANVTPPSAPPSSLASGSSPTPVPTGSALCANSTRDPNATIVISIDPDFAATSTSDGTVFGYAEYDPTGSSPPSTAAQAVPATTSDLIVFANYDPGTVTHSAVGFIGVSSFPPEPYPFPSSAASPVASAISNAPWSTGPLESFGNTSATICYSQTFSVPGTGTFFFGDNPLYNGPSSFRGVITVSQ